MSRRPVHRMFVSVLVGALLLPLVAVISADPAAAVEPPPVYVTQWGTGGTGDGQFNDPMAVAAAPSGNVYVGDVYSGRVQKFDANGTFLTSWGGLGTGDGQFNWVFGVAVGPTGDVYVADAQNRRVQKFDANGTYLTQWGTYGTGPGQFEYPKAIAVDQAGNVYVAEGLNIHRIQKFDSNGTYLTQWGSQGSGDGQFQFSWPGVAIGPTGNVFVADGGNHRVQVFDPNGTYLTQWGTFGTDTGQFALPIGLTVDPLGKVYVADHNNHRVQVFDSDGTFLTTWGTQGSADGEFNGPDGVAVGPVGDIYVTDRSNHRVQVFRPDATDPTVTLTTPPDGATYERDEVVTADYSCADEVGGSGIATCEGTVPDDDPIDTSTVGSHDFTVTATDMAGNESSVTHSYTVTVTGPFHVTNGNDTGSGSYRQAVADASADPTDSVVLFDPDLTVTLASDVVYTGTAALSIQGNGSTVDGDGVARILELSPGGALTVDDLTFTGGVGDPTGGAIHQANGDVQLNAVTLSGNTAEGSASDAMGGAVYAVHGSVTLTDSTATGNRAESDLASAVGGAVAVADGDVTVTHGTMSGNEAETTADNRNAGSGAVHAEGGTITVEADSTLSGNEATTAGCCGGEAAQGGALGTSGTVVVTDSTLHHNSAGPTRAYGGAIGSDRVEVTGSSLHHNTSSGAGGAVVGGPSGIVVVNSTFEANRVDAVVGGGGAIHGEGGPVTVTISGSTFTDNTVTGAYGWASWGGAVDAGTIEATDTTFSGNEVTNSAGPAEGGAIHAHDAVTLTGGTLELNRVEGTDTSWGGAVRAGGTVTVSGATLADNTAAHSSGNGANGGAIYTDGDVTIADDSHLTRNTASSAPGGSYGGAVATFSGSVTITGSTVTDNTASGIDSEYSSADGGAVFAQTTVTITDSTVSANTATSSGRATGGAVWAGGDVEVTGSTLADNAGDHTATSGAANAYGGAIDSEATVTVTDSTLSGNHITSGTTAVGVAQGAYGGAVFGRHGVTVTRTTLSGNGATGALFAIGGAVATAIDGSQAPVSITDSTVSANTVVGTAAGSVGDGAVLADGTVTVTNSTVTDNTATDVGDAAFASTGGIISVFGDVVLRHATVTANAAGPRPGGAQVLVADYHNTGGPTLDTFATVFADPQGGEVNCAVASGTTSGGYNHSTDATCGLTATGDAQDGADPQLGALADNGGLTPTRLPEASSPLVDTIPAGACDPTLTTDQRGAPRPEGPGGACDTGAVERAVDPAFLEDFEDGDADGWEAGGTNGSITAVTSPTAPNGGTYVGRVNFGTSCWGPSIALPATVADSVSWRFRADGDTGHPSGVAFRVGNVALVSYHSNALRYFDSTSSTYVTLQPAATATWYLIELRNIDWDAHTTDVWVDGVERALGAPFTATDQHALTSVGNYACPTVSGPLYIDDITVAGAPAVTGIAGTVTDEVSADPVDGAWVAALRTSDFSIAASAVADAAGDYTADVAAGDYFLYLIDPAGTHAAAFAGPPTTVTGTTGVVTTADATMAPTRGAIAGDVTEDGTGDPVADVWAVTVSGADNAPETGTTANAAGHYRIDGLRPGDHYVAIVDPAGAHRPEFYPDAPDITTADTVAVTAGTTATADLALTAQTPDP
ncbi:MAG TPA: choice-of-anchor Q domain-containing protein, partial [Acidimicrobiales bacterium]|nr:choice-of-anchor Q domain-containing protein [Acidimicrobiales bacterium]